MQLPLFFLCSHVSTKPHHHHHHRLMILCLVLTCTLYLRAAVWMGVAASSQESPLAYCYPQKSQGAKIWFLPSSLGQHASGKTLVSPATYSALDKARVHQRLPGKCKKKFVSHVWLVWSLLQSPFYWFIYFLCSRTKTCFEIFNWNWY